MTQRSRELYCRVITATTGAAALLTGVVTLLGYVLDVRRLTDWGDTNISMFPNAAICAGLSGAALLGQRERTDVFRRVLGCIVGLLGAMTLFEHVTGFNLGIDTLLFQRTWGQSAAAALMRMGPPASTSFVIIGAALWLTTGGAQSRRLAGSLAILIAAIASLSLVGFWFGADHLYGVARFTGISFQTSLTVALISAGLMACVPEHGLAEMLNRNDSGGIMARRLFLPVIAIPLLLGWTRVRAQQAGYIDLPFGAALLSIATIVFLISLLAWTASGMSKLSRTNDASQRAIHESEARLRSIIDQLPAGVGVMGKDGNWTLTNSTMHFYAPTAASTALAERNERWRFWDEQGVPIPIDQWPDTRALRGEAVLPGIEGLYRHEDGREIWMRVSAAPLRSEGEIIGATVVVQDIDLAKRFRGHLEQELAKRSEEMEQAARAVATAQRMAAVGTMASGLAHDIKNVLLPLNARINTVLASIPATSDLRPHFTVIVALADHLRQMAKNLELFARDPEQEGSEGTTQLSAWCRRVQPMLESSLDPGGRKAGRWVRLKCDVPDGLPAVAIAPHRLTQSVLNLVHNSRDAILSKLMARAPFDGPAGTIHIEARTVADGVAITVSDDGPGMNEETRRRCLEPFFTTKDRPSVAGGAGGVGGSGLGLSLVNAMIGRIGGQLQVESEVGAGTHITLLLPAAAGSRPESKPEKSGQATT